MGIRINYNFNEDKYSPRKKIYRYATYSTKDLQTLKRKLEDIINDKSIKKKERKKAKKQYKSIKKEEKKQRKENNYYRQEVHKSKVLLNKIHTIQESLNQIANDKNHLLEKKDDLVQSLDLTATDADAQFSLFERAFGKMLLSEKNIEDGVREKCEKIIYDIGELSKDIEQGVYRVELRKADEKYVVKDKLQRLEYYFKRMTVLYAKNNYVLPTQRKLLNNLKNTYDKKDDQNTTAKIYELKQNISYQKKMEQKLFVQIDKQLKEEVKIENELDKNFDYFEDFVENSNIPNTSPHKPKKKSFWSFLPWN